MGNILGYFMEDKPVDASNLIGMTLEEANNYITYTTVYYTKEDCVIDNKDNRITEVSNEDCKDLRLTPGNMRLNVETSRFNRIITIESIG